MYLQSNVGKLSMHFAEHRVVKMCVWARPFHARHRFGMVTSMVMSTVWWLPPLLNLHSEQRRTTFTKQNWTESGNYSATHNRIECKATFLVLHLPCAMSLPSCCCRCHCVSNFVQRIESGLSFLLTAFCFHSTPSLRVYVCARSASVGTITIRAMPVCSRYVLLTMALSRRAFSF